MRLLNTATGKLETFSDADTPLYAILSHRWTSNKITFQDLHDPHVQRKEGYSKISNSCRIAAKNGLDYLWIDTCCIDKTNSTELSTAVNSMYQWYRDAVVCFAYLSDVPAVDFARSLWFTRGWTLQELLAPSTILRGCDLSLASNAQKMSWAANRVTTVTEDLAYCLMGIFGINIPMLYGEGGKSFLRLQEEILKTTDDFSLFVWKEDGATVDLSDRNGLTMTPPLRAAAEGHVEMARLLLQEGVDREARDKNGRSKMVMFLLDQRVDLEAPDVDNRTCLAHAAIYGCCEAMSIVISRKADLETRDNDGLTPLALAASRAKSNIEALDRNGWTPIFWAVGKGHRETANVCDHLKVTVLSHAERRQRGDIIKLLHHHRRRTERGNQVGGEGNSGIYML
ncbi:ankyrin repeat-containing domain protein [Dichotomopilus funicola]|uniref:Ankyrin repeat-containing domain protein n=1 Tax=Dichotomopilus funicola TaxID=1934379 RepID=A0AAN6V0W9_9PEZI|nr:ankyrin repeat-containing domain protein [Dichotomopilus funicola]